MPRHEHFEERPSMRERVFSELAYSTDTISIEHRTPTELGLRMTISKDRQPCVDEEVRVRFGFHKGTLSVEHWPRNLFKHPASSDIYDPMLVELQLTAREAGAKRIIVPLMPETAMDAFQRHGYRLPQDDRRDSRPDHRQYDRRWRVDRRQGTRSPHLWCEVGTETV